MGPGEAVEEEGKLVVDEEEERDGGGGRGREEARVGVRRGWAHKGASFAK